jgi:hypothetical protein
MRQPSSHDPDCKELGPTEAALLAGLLIGSGTGPTVNDLARATGRSISTVYSWLRRLRYDLIVHHDGRFYYREAPAVMGAPRLRSPKQRIGPAVFGIFEGRCRR